MESLVCSWLELWLFSVGSIVVCDCLAFMSTCWRFANQNILLFPLIPLMIFSPS
jgi:hypothetical protein